MIPAGYTDRNRHIDTAAYYRNEDGVGRALIDSGISIGVSNYNVRLLEELASSSDVVPAVNQIERHPKLQQRDVVRYCREKGIVVEAWAPIMKGQVTGIPLLKDIGERYGKTPAQVALRWHIQQKVVVIPKTSHEDRMAENFSIFDFELSADEMNRIDGLEDGTRFGFDPDEIYEKQVYAEVMTAACRRCPSGRYGRNICSRHRYSGYSISRQPPHASPMTRVRAADRDVFRNR